jgi:2-iminobutanoate/2-iminopropanoate deaminase
MSTPIQYPRQADTPASHLPFSPVVQVGDLVLVSGHGEDRAGHL